MENCQKYYAVVNGRKPGIYDNWKDCQIQTKSFKGSVFKSFWDLDEAQIYLNSNGIYDAKKKIDIIEMVKEENNKDILFQIQEIVQKKLNIYELSQIENDKDQQSGFTSINHELDDLNIKNNKSQQQEFQTFLQDNK